MAKGNISFVGLKYKHEGTTTTTTTTTTKYIYNLFARYDMSLYIVNSRMIRDHRLITDTISVTGTTGADNPCGCTDASQVQTMNCNVMQLSCRHNVIHQGTAMC